MLYPDVAPTETLASPENRSLPSILALSAFSAILLGLALPSELFSLGLWPLGFVALAPLYEALRSSRSHRHAIFAGAVFGALQHAISSYWLFFYKDFALWTIGATTLGYAVVYTLPALYLSFVAKRSKQYGPILFALVWTIFEYGKSTGFLGYPYGLLPYSLSSLPVFLQVADITGVYGLSALLALSSAIFSTATTRVTSFAPANTRTSVHKSPVTVPATIAGPQSLSRTGSRQNRLDTTISLLSWFAFLATCIVLVLAYGLFRLSTPIPQTGSLTAILVQQNIDPWIAGDEAALESNVALARSIINNESTEKKAVSDESAGLTGKPELIIFSETSLRRPYAENRTYYSERPKTDPLIPFLSETGSWLLTGAPYVLDWKDFKVMNAAILIDPKGNLTDFYGKSHPVPFTEAIPLMEFAWFRAFMKNVVGLEGGWTTGTRMTIFAMPLRKGGIVRFGVPICFEDVFSGLCNDFVKSGADILVNITNDSWSQKKSAEVQHWAAARFRAIETRRTLVRSTNGGVSCVIGPTGINLFVMPLFHAQAALVEIPVFKEAGLTVYTQFGDWFVFLCVLLSGVPIIVMRAGIFRIKRRKS